MHLEHQEGEYGCGIACVAMVAGVSYAEAKAKLPKYWGPKGTTKKQMRRNFFKSILPNLGLRIKTGLLLKWIVWVLV